MAEKNSQRKLKKRCPLCNGRLEEYYDYLNNKWLGCVKCEEWEVLIKGAKE